MIGGSFGTRCLLKLDSYPAPPKKQEDWNAIFLMIGFQRVGSQVLEKDIPGGQKAGKKLLKRFTYISKK